MYIEFRMVSDMQCRCRIFATEPGDRWALEVAAMIASDRMQQDLRETRGWAYSLGISADALDMLRRRGVVTTVLELLLQDGFTSQGRPTVWALGPAELQIR